MSLNFISQWFFFSSLQLNFSQLAREYGVRGTTGHIVVKEFLESEGVDLSKFEGKCKNPIPSARRRIKWMMGNYLNLSYLFYTLLQAHSHSFYIFQIVAFSLYFLNCNESLRKKMPICHIQCCTCQ